MAKLRINHAECPESLDRVRGLIHNRLLNSVPDLFLEAVWLKFSRSLYAGYLDPTEEMVEAFEEWLYEEVLVD